MLLAAVVIDVVSELESSSKQKQPTACVAVMEHACACSSGNGVIGNCGRQAAILTRVVLLDVASFVARPQSQNGAVSRYW